MSQRQEAFSPEEFAAARRHSMLIQWSPEDQAYAVSVPELPGLMTHGDTREQVARLGEEAIALCLAGLRARGRSVSVPRFRVASV